MAVLLVGSTEVPELEHLAAAVRDRGGEPRLVDVRDWPGETLSLTPGERRAEFGTAFEYDEVRGAYFHAQALFRPAYRVSELDGEVAPTLNNWREHRSLFESLCRIFESDGIDVLPRLHNHYMQERKPWQLDRYLDRGVPVPDTVFTNDPERVRAFYDRHDRVIYKPVSIGAPPHELTEEDLTPERLEQLATAPIQLQEFVPGDDLRLYVLDGEVVGATRYVSDNFSFKLDQQEHEEVELEPASVSDEVETTAVRATEAVGLEFGAADVRRSEDGHALLEVNQTPTMTGADVLADQRVAEAVADYLLDGGDAV